MDLSRVVKDEEERQRLIKEQEGGGVYNPLTGVYKYGKRVYDLTKTNGDLGLYWPPIRSKLIRF